MSNFVRFHSLFTHTLLNARSKIREFTGASRRASRGTNDRENDADKDGERGGNARERARGAIRSTRGRSLR